LEHVPAVWPVSPVSVLVSVVVSVALLVSSAAVDPHLDYGHG